MMVNHWATSGYPLPLILAALLAYMASLDIFSVSFCSCLRLTKQQTAIFALINFYFPVQ